MKLQPLAIAGIICMLAGNAISAQKTSPVHESNLVEICDNQIDDDNDGYIDCYDTDCACYPTVECTAEPGPPGIKARMAWQSGSNAVSVTATPIVANLNPQTDAIAEIIVAEAATSDTLVADRLLFFKGDGSNADAPFVLTIPTGFDFFPVPAPVVGDVDNDGIPEMIIVCNDKRIRVYNDYSEDPDNPMSLWITTSEQVDFSDQKPYLADFDADGTPEVYAGNNIFKFDFSDPDNPKLIKRLGGPGYKGHCSYFEYVEGSASPVAVNLLKPNECLGDPDCDGLELAAGPVIYSVDVNLGSDGYELVPQRNLHDFDPANTYADGYTAVADVNLDGVPELVVSSKRNADEYGVYVWNKYQLVGFLPFSQKSRLSGSAPCIANVFDDRTAGFAKDFPEIIVACKSQLVCFNLQAAQLDPNKPYWWILDIVDLSSFTTCSAFDLDGDGTMELMYRDEEFFRILYGGAAPFPAGVDAERHWVKIPCGSVTSDEYPVVTDVDNDGATEILVTGFTFSGYNDPKDDYRGRLQVYKSDAAPWAPSRQIWNQFGYFGVNVNDDLSIPIQQQAHHLEFPAPGSGKRPFNQFLAQMPGLDANFEPYLPAPDAYAQVESAECNGNSITVEISICNDGSMPLPIGLSVTFYETNPTTTIAQPISAVSATDRPVQPNSCETFVFQLPVVSGEIFGVVNDDGTVETPFDLADNFPVTDVSECDWLNNLFSFEYNVQAQPFDLGADTSACAGSTVQLSAGPNHLSYLWQDGSTDSLLQVQAPGLYWVEVTDVCYGTRQDTIEVNYLNPPEIEINAINGDCSGTPASASAMVNSANFPLSFQWSNGSTDPVISNLDEGTYWVTVTDGKGCSSIDSVQVETGGQLLVEANISEILCTGETGAVNLEIIAGTAPFGFEWQDGSTLDNLAAQAGNYTVTITDADGCTQTLNIELTEPLPLVSQGLEAQASCPDVANGAIEIQGVSQGTPPYSFLWSNDSTDPGQVNLAGGIYTVTVTDANGCTHVASDTVQVYQMPELQSDITDISCFGDSDGSIAVSGINAVPVLEYAWSTNASTPTIENLGPGSYELSITYGNGFCKQTHVFEVQEPAPLVLQDSTVTSANCFGEASGAIELNLTGGIAPYNSVWSDGQIGNPITGLSAGNYSVTSTDANGCTLESMFSVTEPEKILAQFTVAPDSCSRSTGEITVDITGGISPYGYLWNTGDNSPQLQNQAAGFYKLTVTDANSCTLILQPEIPASGEAPELLAFTDTITCTNSLATIGLTANQTGLQFDWSGPAGILPDQPTQQVSVSGTYFVTATNTSGCSSSSQLEVEENTAPPQVDAGPDNAQLSCGNGTITLTGTSNPTGNNISEQWGKVENGILVNIVSADQITVADSGLYVFSVFDQTNGCEASDSVWVAGVASLQGIASADSISCFGASDGSIEINYISGGTPPFLYSIDQTNYFADSVFSDLDAGVYDIGIMDALGCNWDATVQIAGALPFSVALSANKSIVSPGENVELTALLSPPDFQPAAIIWVPADLADFTPMSLEQTVQISETVEVEITVMNSKGCLASDRILIRVYEKEQVYIPNAIMPESVFNGVFTVFAGPSVREVKHLRVFDRWGNLVFENLNFAPNDPTAGWDGTCNGKDLSPGVYFWFSELEFQNGNTELKKGNVTLIR